MGRLIVTQFITLDGVIEDPDGSDHTTFGGWAMRHGPQGVAGDKFRLGPVLEQGTLLFGRRTWEHFSNLWPHRDDPFSQAMNSADKRVVTHRDIDPVTWRNSQAIDRPLTAWVHDHVADLVDEYRLLTFPTAVGPGRHLFSEGRQLELVSAERVGPAVLSVLTTRAA